MLSYETIRFILIFGLYLFVGYMTLKSTFAEFMEEDGHKYPVKVVALVLTLAVLFWIILWPVCFAITIYHNYKIRRRIKHGQKNEEPPA